MGRAEACLGAFGAVAAMFWAMSRLGKPDPGMGAYPEFPKADVEDLIPFDGDDRRPRTPKANGHSRPDKAEAPDIKV